MIKWLTFPVTQPTTSGNCQQKHLVNAIIIDPWPSLANSRLEKLPQMQNGSVQETEEDQRQTHGSINYYCLNSYNVQNISVENSHNNIPVTRLSFFPSTSASVSIWLEYRHSVIRSFNGLSSHFPYIVLHSGRLGGLLYTSDLSLW